MNAIVILLAAASAYGDADFLDLPIPPPIEDDGARADAPDPASQEGAELTAPRLDPLVMPEVRRPQSPAQPTAPAAPVIATSADVVEPSSGDVAPVSADRMPAVNEPPAVVEAAPREQLLDLGKAKGVTGATVIVRSRLLKLDATMEHVSGVGLLARHGRYGFGVVGYDSGSGSLGTTYAGLVGTADVYDWRFLDVSVGAMLGGGSARTATAGGFEAESVGVLVFEPELAVHARLLPWARGTISAGYRMVDAGEWGGPTGDVLGGFAVGVGLEVGSF